ncbi:hypothetical protein SAMN05518855_10278 [Paenibacillus sp. CF384]|nr:hypothetical protein SAMN05518855_10278 [Paenibacillus sp. CF384]
MVAGNEQRNMADYGHVFLVCPHEDVTNRLGEGDKNGMGTIGFSV